MESGKSVEIPDNVPAGDLKNPVVCFGCFRKKLVEHEELLKTLAPGNIRMRWGLNNAELSPGAPPVEIFICQQVEVGIFEQENRQGRVVQIKMQGCFVRAQSLVHIGLLYKIGKRADGSGKADAGVIHQSKITFAPARRGAAGGD